MTKNTTSEKMIPPVDELRSIANLFDLRDYESVRARSSQMIRDYPNFPVGWKFFGAALSELGEDETAIVAKKMAVQLDAFDSEAISNLALSFRKLGRWEQAIDFWKKISTNTPHTLALLLYFGEALFFNNDKPASLSKFRKASLFDTTDPFYYAQLGNFFFLLESFNESELCFKKAISLQPTEYRFYLNHSLALHKLGRLVESINSCNKSISLAPDEPAGYSHLGLLACDLGQYAKAEKSLIHAAKLNNDDAFTLNSLGNVYAMQNQHGRAIEHYKKSTTVRPDFSDPYSNLGQVLKEIGQYGDAEICFKKALAIENNNAAACNNYAGMLLSLGRLDEAEEYYNRAIASKPYNTKAFSNLLLCMNYNLKHNSEKIFEKAKIYGNMVTSNTPYKFNTWNCRADTKTLRIGFVSGDFRNHPVGYLVESLLLSIDKKMFELFAYHTYSREDDLTSRLKTYFKKWETVHGMNDLELASRIHQDRIHILIDLAGHTAKNRLPVFAYKPAPVQISWLGYCGTTGLSEIDYVLADGLVIPLGESKDFCEKIFRLQGNYWCFAAPNYNIQIEALPMKINSYITFGCFNTLQKINHSVISLWSQILRSIPNSRLLLKNSQLSNESVAASIFTKFSDHGIAKNRIILEGPSSREDYLKAYNKVDVALDPFPFPGGVTSIEGLWMGVPFITLDGERFYSRNGVSIASCCGLNELIASNEKEYVEKAVRISSNAEYLENLRYGLRDKILMSPLFNGELFSRQFEKALVAIWNEKNKFSGPFNLQQ